MNNKGIAFGDLFKIISEGNTAIIHYSFMRQPDKRKLAYNLLCIPYLVSCPTPLKQPFLACFTGNGPIFFDKLSLP